MNQEIWLKRSHLEMKLLIGMIKKSTICLWTYSTQCQYQPRLLRSTWLCTVVFRQSCLDLIRLTKSIDSKRSHLMEYSATWCGLTLWTMKQQSMGISQRIQNVIVQSTSERNLWNHYLRRISYWVYSEDIKLSKTASTCISGAAETHSHM